MKTTREKSEDLLVKKGELVLVASFLFLTHMAAWKMNLEMSFFFAGIACTILVYRWELLKRKKIFLEYLLNLIAVIPLVFWVMDLKAELFYHGIILWLIFIILEGFLGFIVKKINEPEPFNHLSTQ